MPAIQVTPGIVIDRSELAFSFARAGGPGGQNVNKVETAVQLRFDVAHSPSLDDAVKRRLKRLAGTRLTKDGVLVIFARAHRSQERNRQDALARLLRLIAAAAGKAGISRENPPQPRGTANAASKPRSGAAKQSALEIFRSSKPIAVMLKQCQLHRWTATGDAAGHV